jgi:hypothetical protein
MHKPPLMIFRSDDNSRHIREIGHDLRDADPPINILAVGGGEFEGVGVFSFTFDNDDDETLARVRAIAEARSVPLIDWDGVTVELPNVPGALGDMAEALEEQSINISSLLVAGTHGSSALVLVGIPEGLQESAEEALRGKGFYVFEDHHET